MSVLSVGLSCCDGKGLDIEGFYDYKNNGIDCMEISVGGYTEVLDYEMLKQNADETGVKLWSIHLPFSPFSLLNPAFLDESKREYTVKYFTRLLKRASAAQFEVAVIHPSGEPNADGDRPRLIEQAKKSFAELADVADSMGMRIAVEDIPRSCLCNCSKEMLEILDADKRLGVCFDTNHLLEEDNVDFIKAVGDRIITTHVSDYDFLNERHWLPGEGKQDWQAVYHALLDCGYTGPWMYELGYKAPGSISRPRKLTATDFRRNADEIFENRPLTVIGTPASNLKHWKDK